jgi:SurA-like protein
MSVQEAKRISTMRFSPEYRSWMSVIILVLLFCSAPAMASNRPTVGAVAVVNGAVISRGDLDRETERLRRQGERRAGTSAALQDIGRQALDNLIQRELLFQESRREGITVDDAAVDRQVARLQLQLGGAAALTPVLEALQVTEEELRRDIARGIAIQRYIDGRFPQPAAVTAGETGANNDNHQQERKSGRELRRHLEELRRKAAIELLTGGAVSL